MRNKKAREILKNTHIKTRVRVGIYAEDLAKKIMKSGSKKFRMKSWKHITVYQDLNRFEFKIGYYYDNAHEQSNCIYMSLMFWTIEIEW